MPIEALRNRLRVNKEVAEEIRREGVPSTPRILASLEAKVAASHGRTGEYVQHAEVHRICELPIVFPMTQEELDEFSREHVLAEAYNDGFRLLPAQANGLMSYLLYGGIFGPIGVGQGKTLLTLMVANAAYQKGLRRMMLMVPPEILSQLTNDIKTARTKVAINYPIHIMGGRSLSQRRMLANSGKKGLYIFPYSLLSTADTDENLVAIQPEIIIGDEVHRIANPKAARTRRLTAYLEEIAPEFIAVSGTITSKSVMDYYHLCRAALRKMNPLPNTKSLAYEWASVIDATQSDWDSDSDSGPRSGPGPLIPLVHWAQKNFREEKISDSRDGFRKAFKLRLTTCPGVVSADSDIGTSLIFTNKKITDHKDAAGWDKLEQLINKVEDAWLTPNDDEIEHAIHKWKWLYELSAGFYNELVWPTPEDFARRRRITESEAKEVLDGAKTYHEAGQEYAKTLRRWLEKEAKPGLDTPFLVGGDMGKHGSKNVGTELYGIWQIWKGLDFKGRPDRDSHAVRVCDYKIRAAIEWAKSIKDHGGIIWYFSIEMGAWIYELMLEAGIDAVHCPAGANEEIADKVNANKKVIASISAHGTGKNLQHFQHQCFVQWPRQAKMAEQVLGRLHRTGQTADELTINTFNTIEFDELNFAACLNDSLYIHQTTGVRQKLIYGGYDPLPKIFPPAVLRERGAEGVKMLTLQQRKLLEEKFGQ